MTYNYNRARVSATLTDEQITDLLMSARKKAFGKLENVSKLNAIFQRLGWQMVPIVGLSSLDISDTTKWYSASESEDGDNQTMIDLEKRLKEYEVGSLPASPKVDQVYLQNVDRNPRWISAKFWVGASGYKITSPEGKIFELLPDKYSYTGGSMTVYPWTIKKIGPKNTKYIRYYDLFKWLYKETGFLQDVLDVLEMPSLEEARARDQKLRTRDNTGTCAVCRRNIKLKKVGDKYTMVDHGYQRPGVGYHLGQCFGVDYPPYELSSEGCKAFAKHLEIEAKALQKQVADIVSGKTTSLVVKDYSGKSKVIQDTDPSWERIKDEVTKDLRRKISNFETGVKEYLGYVANWVLAELPTATS